MRRRMVSAAFVVVLLTACGSGDGERPAITATLPPDASGVRPTSPPGTEAPAPTEPIVTEPPATAPPIIEPPATPSPETTPAAEPTDESDDGTVWWPWVLGGLVLIGAIVALVGRRRRPQVPSWQMRATTLFDEVEQLTSHLVALAPDGLHIVAGTDAGALATMRATLADLIASAPDSGRATVLNGLSRPLAELHAAVDAIALSGQSIGVPVAQLAAQLHTAATTARADLAARG